MPTAHRIEQRLREAFPAETVAVRDDSEQHRGHGGWREGGGTHFHVTVVSDAFAGKSRIERHRMVNAALAAELAAGVHALAISAKAPGE